MSLQYLKPAVPHCYVGDLSGGENQRSPETVLGSWLTPFRTLWAADFAKLRECLIDEVVRGCCSMIPGYTSLSSLCQAGATEAAFSSRL